LRWGGGKGIELMEIIPLLLLIYYGPRNLWVHIYVKSWSALSLLPEK
jgi:hypothetical protein